MTSFLIGQQQILDKNLNIFGYEILFRGNDFDLRDEESATLATNQVITDTIIEFGLNAIVGPHKAFINFTRQNLLSKTPLHLPKDQVVIEVLENIKVDKLMVNTLQNLSQQGYMIALDDFVFSPEWIPLIEIANIIKLDVMQYSRNEISNILKKLQGFKGKILAEKVETQEDFDFCKSLSFDYFQGYFFSKPIILEGQRIGVNQQSTINLLSIINKPNVEIKEIATTIAQDPALSYKLLNYLNSAKFVTSNRIESIQHATVLLGLQEIKRWVNILSLSALTPQSQAALQISLIRAKMCEFLAEYINETLEPFFMVGLFSNLDSLLQQPLEKIIPKLPIDNEISEAILEKKGNNGKALDCVINYEQWNFQGISFYDIELEKLGQAYLQSLNWTHEVLSNLKA